jgi:hypothetical protein
LLQSCRIRHAWALSSGLCLQAMPGAAGGRVGGGVVFRLPQPATLTQMPCNGSSAQQFANVDADYSRRHGPH